MQAGKANAMSPALVRRLAELCGEIEASDARALVITGDGRSFSAGLALPELIDLDRAVMRGFMDEFKHAMLRVFALPMPVVAAIDGHAIAGGCVLALMCDWRVMLDDERARIGLNEAQLGIGLPSVVVEPLRAQVPAASLVPIALEGRLFAPSQALAVGLVHEVVPAAELRARAAAKAGALAELPPVAIGQIKQALRRPVLEAIARHAAEETDRWLDSWFAPGARDRLRAAVEKLKR
jgi:enoyl-CoA hydratase